MDIQVWLVNSLALSGHMQQPLIVLDSSFMRNLQDRHIASHVITARIRPVLLLPSLDLGMQQGKGFTVTFETGYIFVVFLWETNLLLI